MGMRMPFVLAAIRRRWQVPRVIAEPVLLAVKHVLGIRPSALVAGPRRFLVHAFQLDLNAEAGAHICVRVLGPADETEQESGVEFV